MQSCHDYAETNKSMMLYMFVREYGKRSHNFLFPLLSCQWQRNPNPSSSHKYEQWHQQPV